MVAKIPYDELPPELQSKVSSSGGLIKPKHVALGKVLLQMQSLTHRDAVWVLRIALNMVSGRTWRSHKNALNKSYQVKKSDKEAL